MTIQRMNLFKIPSPENIPPSLAEYQKLQSAAVKDSKPYILSVQAGAVLPDVRAKGYTLAVKIKFSSLEDMRYYDEWCAAHMALKAAARTKGVEGALTVYFENAVGNWNPPA